MKNAATKPRKLAFKLAKISVLVAFLLGLLLSSFQVYLDYQKQGESVDIMVEKILSVAQRPATTSVHLLSKDLANEVVSGLLEYDFIQEAIITDDLNLILAQNLRQPKSESKTREISSWLGETFKAYMIQLHPPSVSKDTPGHLKVIVDMNQAYASFYDRAIVVFLGGFIRNILLTLLLIWIFYHIITRPLETITDQFSKREPSDPGDKPIALPSGHENDEFTALVGKVNDFLLASRNHIQELHQKNFELEKTYQMIEDNERKYRNLYQSTDVSIWEEDFSLLFKEIEKLRNENIVNIRHYLNCNPKHLKAMSKMVKVLDVNQATLRLYAIENKKSLINNIFQVFDEESSLEIFAAEVEAIWDQDTFFRMEANQKTFDGELISVIVSLPVPKTLEDSYRVPVTLLDITQLKSAQEQVRKLSLAIQHNPSAVVITDLNGTIEYVNPKVNQITGHSDAELVGTSISKLRLSENQLLPEDELWKKLNAGLEWRSEVTAKRKNGEYYWAREFIAPIKDRLGLTTHFVAIYEDISEEKRIFDEISYRATHDKLTHLFNRDEFERRLEKSLFNIRHAAGSHILCFIDLDQFKVINDTSGHIAGDELLKQLAKVFEQHIRKHDTLARIGGDEFGILLEHCSLQKAEECMQDIAEQVSEFQFQWQAQIYKVSISVGITEINASSTNTTELFKQADLACYVAKERGRNQIHVYDPNDQLISVREGEMHRVSDISSALKENRFSLFVQPIVPLTEAYKLPCYEVLIRMFDQDGGFIPPNEFLPSAERYGLSPAIDKWVITNLFEWVHNNPSSLSKIQHFAINLSGRTIGDESIIASICSELKNANLPAEKFSFEITETAAITNFQQANQFIKKLKGFGCTVALDDFGSGVSSFAYLKNLDIDYLKIDGIFVKEILNNKVDEAMVKAIHTVGKELGLITIAEFVESQQIAEHIKLLGIDYAQGYGTGKPAPIDEYFH